MIVAALMLWLMAGCLGVPGPAAVWPALAATAVEARPALPAGNAPQPAPRLRVYRTGFYELHTDVLEIEAREAAVRMDATAAEFLQRTRGFKRAPPPPYMQFKLFRRLEDYEADGGTPGSGGQFDRRSGVLMAVAGQRLDERTWHRVQHEAFHQFAHHTLGELPPWLSEGLAEYFAESAFTGDSLVTGLVPDQRRGRVVSAMEESRFLPIEQMMLMTHEQWNHDLARNHYDQAWSLVVYLLHGENGRHAQRFEQFLVLCSQGRPWQLAWRETFRSTEGLERGWLRWWESLPESPSAGAYREATMRTLTSFWARAVSQGQAVGDFNEFVRLGRAGQLAFDDRQWLPPSLLQSALDEARSLEEEGGAFVIRRMQPRSSRAGRGVAARPRNMSADELELVLLLPDGTAYRGRFVAESGRIGGVVVGVQHLPEDLMGEFEKLQKGRPPAR